MELRKILNRAESTIITAKSYNANNSMEMVQSNLLDLKEFLNRELVNHSSDDLDAATPTEPPAEAMPEFNKSESKPGAGVVSEPAESESKPDAGVVNEPDKSQSKPGSGVV